MKPEISIIVRTKNEEKWIRKCLESIETQHCSYSFEVIIVDSGSIDATLQKAMEFNFISIIRIDHYLPGYAINEGIRSSSGSVIVLLSAHCIATSDSWLNELVTPIFKKEVRATYGRQVPTPGSSARDTRDLLITFGIEDKIQRVDTFFHNANSAFSRELWSEVSFNEKVTNIEDRLWAEEVITRGDCIKYVSKACVFHWHGIHQDGNVNRERTTAKVLKESTRICNTLPSYKTSTRKCVAIIPVREKQLSDFQKRSINRTCQLLATSKIPWSVFFCSYEAHLFTMPPGMSYQWLDRSAIDKSPQRESGIFEVVEYILKQHDSTNRLADLICILNIEYIFRNIQDLDQAVYNFDYYDADFCYANFVDNLSTDNRHEIKEVMDCLDVSISDLLSQSKKIRRDGEIMIPGYFTIVHPSVIRIKKTESIYSLKQDITGQEKLLKIKNKSELAAIEAVINREIQDHT